MIINIRGTSGSGKSTLVREAMSWFKCKEAVRVPGRKQPLYYKLWHSANDCILRRPPDLVVIGHYEASCGGCDTIPNLDMAFNLVFEAAGFAQHVIFEGLLLSSDVNRCVELHQTFGADGFEVLAIDLPLEQCLASVNARRRAKDPTKEDVNPANTEAKFKGVRMSLDRLRAAGVSVQHLCREECEARLATILLGM